MLTHVEIQELIPAYVLNALEPHEMRNVESHLRTCAECRHMADEYRAVPEALALSVPQISPPPELKSRTLSAAQFTPSPKSTRVPQIRARPFRLTPWLAAAALGVALIALVLAVWQGQEIRQELGAQRDLLTVMAYAEGPIVDVRAPSPGSRATGKLYLDPDSAVAALIAVNLPPLDEAHVYQVWLSQPDGEWVSGGLFRVDQEGNGWLLIRAPKPLAAYNGAQVSLEMSGGAAKPSGPTILQTALGME